MTSARRRIVAALLASLLAGGFAVAPHAQAYSANGRVTSVPDGDTVYVDIYGDGTSKPVRIRMIGIQAMELGDPATTADDECGAASAKVRLKALVNGKVVTLTSRATSSKSEGRPLRYLSVSGVGDIGTIMLKEGHALAWPDPYENQRNKTYLTKAQEARAAGLRIYNPTYCRSGPYQSTPLKLWVKWDADGDDSKNINGEWVRIRNNGSSAISVSRWWVRDSAHRRYFFPTGTSIPAGGHVTVYMGKGTTTSTKFYWGLSTPVFGNFGDGAYLFDRDGDLRASMIYPCYVSCTDPLKGKMYLSANWDAYGDDRYNANGEWVNLTNTSSSAFNLQGYILSSWPNAYAFGSNTTLKPGERMRIYVGKGTQTRLTKFWGKSAGFLNNAGESAKVKTFDGITVASVTWPCSSCESIPNVRFQTVNYDAVGDDLKNPNGEYVIVKNYGSTDLNLRDWMIQSYPYTYDFKYGVTLSPGETVTLKIGSGSWTSNLRYWGHSYGVLANAGDSVELFTPRRARADCVDWGNDRRCG